MAAAAAAKLAPQIIGLLTGGKAKGGQGHDDASIGQARFEFQGLKDGAKALVDMNVKAVQFLNPAHQFANAIGFTTDAFAKGVAVLTEPIQAVTAGFKSMQEAVSALGAGTAEFVKLSDPNAVVLFELAMKDAMAAIGHAVAPIMELGTAVQRSFGDIVAALAPAVGGALQRALGPLTEALPKLTDAAAPLVRAGGRVADLFGRLGESVTRLLTSEAMIEGLTAVMQLFETALDPVLVAVELLAAAFAKVAQWTAAFAKSLNDLFGGGRPERAGGIAGRSVGLAATNAKMGSVEAFTSEAFVKAFQQGKGLDPAVETKTAVQAILAFLQDGKLGEVVWKELQKAAKEIAAALADVIPGAGAVRALAGGDPAGAARAVGLPPAAVDAIREGGDALDGLRARADEWMRDVGFWRP